MKHISETDLQELKNKLLEEKELLESQLSKIAHKLPNGDDWVVNYEKPEPTPDPSDNADRLEAMAGITSTFSELEARYSNINQALKKMETGKYGICEATGQPIEIDRLKANPAAKVAKAAMNKEE